jgi:hypothetical protein
MEAGTAIAGSHTDSGRCPFAARIQCLRIEIRLYIDLRFENLNRSI